MDARLNLMTPDVRANPYPLYAELRRTPIREVEPGGMWAISRYEDVIAVMKDPVRFSSAGLARSFLPPWLERNPTADSLVMKDPPAHGRLRGRVNRAFGPAALERLQPRVRAIAEELAECVVSRVEVDFVAGFAVALPVRVLGLLFGFTPEQHPRLKVWADDLLSIPASQPTPERQMEIRESIAAMERCFVELLDARQADPGDDLVSELLRSGEDGVVLTREELISFLFGLVPAGVETTVHLLSNTMVVLSEHRQQVDRVREDLRLVPKLVEEILRYEPPAHGSLRLVTEETVLSGVTLPRGAMLAVLLASALRDERQFPQADRFLLDREKQGNLAFGHGIHFCLGSLLARMEARLGLEALFSRIRGFSLKGSGVQWAPSFIARGPVCLPLVFDPGAEARGGVLSDQL